MSTTNQELFKKLATRTVDALRREKPRDNPHAKNNSAAPRRPIQN